MKMTSLQIALFWTKVDAPSQFQCWHWTGATTDSGYGKVKIDKRHYRAHRIAYELIYGSIGDELIIRHTCDNKICCNPHHLLTGTDQQNSDDAVQRERTPRGTTSGKSKISEEQANYIRKNPDNLTLSELAKKFNMAKSSISYIRSGRSWKYLVGDSGVEPLASTV